MAEDKKQRHYIQGEQLMAEQNLFAATVGGAFAILASAFAYGNTVQHWPH